MSVARTAARRASAVSLSLHSALLAGLLALSPRTPPAGPIGIAPGAADRMSLGLVRVEDAPPSPNLHTTPHPQPVVQAALPAPRALTVPVPPPSELNGIQTVGHVEVSPWRLAPDRAAAPTIERHATSNATPAPVSPAAELPPGTATTFFDVPAVGRSVVFVIDRSMSMGLDGRLDRAKREVVASLRRLPPTARFQVIAYDRAAEPLTIRGQSGLLSATPEAVEAAVSAVERLTAEGGTNHPQALNVALALQPDVIYFLTDEDELKLADVSAFTRRNYSVCVHALCLVPPLGAETPMQALARQNRGVFRAVAR